MLLWSYHI
uniref:Uncharacterized protein n=1 Tax=Rhizophora mucronata TaxID=61149 RepID=A0A2P2QZ53_RHIMU